MKRVLRGFKGGNGQSPPNVARTGPAPDNGLADPAVLLPLAVSRAARGGVGSCSCRGCIAISTQEGFSGKTAFVAPGQD